MAISNHKLFYLQNCSAGYVGNSPVFWRAGGSGYTQWIDEAQKFTKDEADDIIRSTRSTHQWRKHRVDLVDKLSRITVDIQALNKHYDSQKQPS